MNGPLEKRTALRKSLNALHRVIKDGGLLAGMGMGRLTHARRQNLTQRTFSFAARITTTVAHGYCESLFVEHWKHTYDTSSGAKTETKLIKSSDVFFINFFTEY
jgi:hypothetical protein